MKTDQKLTITTAAKVKVEGSIVQVTEADISVMILSPYTRLRTGMQIPFFSKPLNSFLTGYGERTAENLLGYLYDLGNYMEQNEKFINLQFAFHFRDEAYRDEDCRRRFFDSTFPFMVPLDTREDVMRSLLK